VTRRDAILEGAQAALRLHEQLGTRQALESAIGCVDVFDALLDADVALLFRPLEGLLGFCIKGPETPGVVVSTQRPLHIQRFTGAHELGHVALGHTMSLDGDEILQRGGSLRDEREVAANSFASSFLLPRWLLQLHARRQGWNRASMEDPHAVYQLALRLGASYHATCVALERHGIIDSNTREKLIAKPRRELKIELLHDVGVENLYADVWVLTERDEGLTLEGQPDDLFVLRLGESGSAGYVWNTAELAESGFTILRDKREIPPLDAGVGGKVTRALTLRRSEPASGTLALEQKRPWAKAEQPAAFLHVTYDLFGKEVGLARAARRQLMAA
jgi:Zn-dependent peptidase ImmA (M78 family)/predicted secreted protein